MDGMDGSSCIEGKTGYTIYISMYSKDSIRTFRQGKIKKKKKKRKNKNKTKQQVLFLIQISIV